jgi:hypothetical protein
VIEWEDDFILETITKKIVPTTGERAELKRRVKKLANDEMKLMFSFERKFQRKNLENLQRC